MRFRTSLLTLLMAAAPISLRATNPGIGVERDPADPTILFSNNFTFGADSKGGGDLSFQNESGQNWLELSVFATLTFSTPITCGPGPFVICTVIQTPESGKFLYDIVFGPVVTGGIPNGAGFSINLNTPLTSKDPSGSGGWPAGEDFSGKANDIAPEPSARMLFLAGGVLLAGVFRYRRRRALVV